MTMNALFQDEKPRLFDVLNDREVILCSSDRKLKVLDVDKMEVKKSFQGKMFQHIPFTPYGYLEIAILKERGGTDMNFQNI